MRHDGFRDEPADGGFFAAARPPAPAPATPDPEPLPPAVLLLPAPRRRRSGGVVAAVLVLAGLAVAVTAFASYRATQVQALRPLRAVTDVAPAASGWSPAYVDDEGDPARWDGCAPVHYAVSRGGQPAHGRADLAEALRRISAATGLRFVDDGDVDERPSSSRPAYQPDRYGDRWAPLLVAWSRPGEGDLGLGGGVAGVAGIVAVEGPAGGSIVSGQVVVDGSLPLVSGFGPGSTLGEVLLHELTHAVGLGHVDDPNQVMNPSTTASVSAFGKGDLAGLRALGAEAGCRPAPEPRDLRIRLDATA